MNIYTSYFGRVRKLKDAQLYGACVPVVAKFTRWIGKEHRARNYAPLAPDAALLKRYKDGELGSDAYDALYYEALQKLDCKQVVAELFERVEGDTVVLLCYEKPCDYCHRHTVARWLQEHGYSVEEWSPQGTLL